MNARWTTRLLTLTAIAVGAWLAISCTVIRYVDDDGGTTTGPPPKEVDMLVMVDLSRGTANLTADYGKILGTVIATLAEQNVAVRQAAMAPLYGRAEGAVPLLYGEPDEDGEFNGFDEAIAFYTYDDGAAYLQSEAAADSENLATLGQELDSRAIYKPTMADTDGTPFFTEPADGFVVLYLSASPRKCSAGEGACAVDGVDPVQYFTNASGGTVDWLQLAGGASLPVDKVFHGAIVTAENTDYDAFYDQCAAYPNFPIAQLDVMQPSEENAYFGPFVEGIQNNGGAGEIVDLCEAMSGRGEPAVIGLAAKIRQMF